MADAVVAGTPWLSGDIATIPLRVGADERSVWIRNESIDLTSAADAAFVLAYALAMTLDLPCRFESPVSETLLSRISPFGDVQRSWYDFLGEPSIVGPTRPDSRREDRGERGAFFSGGLDSFHTAITERSAIDALVFVLGADIPVHEHALAVHVTARLELAAAELGIPLARVATNLRETTDDYANWEWFVGPAMCAIALALAPRFSSMLYSASHSGRMTAGRRTDSEAIGGDRLRVLRHEGAPNRVAKAQAIGASRSVRAHLRVCWENRGLSYNCGRCPKCTRTMWELANAGALALIETLPAHVDTIDAGQTLGTHSVERAFLAELTDIDQSADSMTSAVKHSVVSPHRGSTARVAPGVRRVVGSLRRRIRPSQPRFAGTSAPTTANNDVDPHLAHSVDLSTRLAGALRPLFGPHRAVALVGLSPANAGDAVIWAGTLRLLERWKIRVAHISMFPDLNADQLRRRLPAGPIVIAGGGNLGTLYPYLQEFRADLLTTFRDRPVIQLPQSIHIQGDNDGRVGSELRGHSDFTLCVRDAPSGRRAEALGLSTTLCPDMAFALSGPELVPPRRVGNSVLWLGRNDAERGRARGPVDARIDYLDLAQGPRRINLGDVTARRAGSRGCPTLAAAARSRISLHLAAWAWSRVGSASAVVTERLHGHILCLLTGTPHVVIPDKYGKIVDFVETWDTRRNGVEFVDDPAEAVAIAHRLAAERARRLT